MATETLNLKLKKYDGSDTTKQSRLDQKANMDILDKVISDKVDKEEGKGLSTFDYNNAEKLKLEEHKNKAIASETGVHGMRYFEDKLQVKNESDVWIDTATGGGGIAPSNVIGFSAAISNSKITLYWGDPEDTVIEGQTLCTWKGTKILMKAGAYPENAKDGTVIIDNQNRNAYKNTGFVLNNLNNGTTYYFQAFPYSDKNAINENTKNRVKGTPQPFKVMTIKIDQNNSNPETSVTYHDDAVGMTPKSDVWDEFFGHKPCLFKDGKVLGYLMKNNFTQFENGYPADITSGNNGDVMIEFPRRGIRISTANNVVTISMTDNPNDDNFEYYAHQRGGLIKDFFYLGAYKGYETGGKLRSLSGKNPTVSKTISQFRSIAKANGTSYDQSAFYQLLYRQVMYLLKYKNLNSQSALGRGYVDGNSGLTSTGNTNQKGMDWGETTGKQQMKLFGIEDFWGNVREWVDGLFCDSNFNILTNTQSFNDTGSGYNSQGKGTSQNISGWMSKIQGTTETGFICKEVSGSGSTYFSDSASLYSGCLPSFGSYWSDGDDAGAFRLCVHYSASSADGSLSARLMYL